MEPQPVQIEALHDHIESLRAHWQRWQNHPNVDIDFYQTILQHRPEILRPNVLLASRDGTPKALLVGRIERRKRTFQLGYLKLFESELRVLTIPSGGLLGNTSQDICHSLLHNLIGSLKRKEADMIHFSHLRTDSPLYGLVRDLLPWHEHYAHPCTTHRAMTLFSTSENFYASLSSKTRKHLKQNARRLSNDFPNAVVVRTYTKTAELDTIVRDVESIAQKTWQRGFGLGFSNDPEMLSRLRLQAEHGWLRANVLYIAEKPCAFWLGTAYHNTLHSEYLGYDPAYSIYAPGMFLLAHVIEGLCSTTGTDRLTTIDFGKGDALYKQQLGTQSWMEGDLEIYSSSIRGLGINLLIRLLGLVDRSVRAALKRVNLRDRVKTYWRKAVRPPPLAPKPGSDKR